MTHVHNVGLTLTHTATGDNTPIVLQLKSEEDAIVADEVIASLEFAAGDSDGTDAADVAAGIHAIAEGTFGANANATKLVFTTAVQESANSAATAKMTLSSAGLLTIADDFLLKDDGTIGNASVADVMTLASTGIVTFKDDILIKDGGTIGVASSTSAITIASTGIVTFVDDIVIKDGGTIGSSTTGGAITIASGGKVTTSGDLQTGGNIIIPDGGTVGSVNDSDMISFGGGGVTTFTSDNNGHVPIAPTRNINNVGFGTGLSFRLGDSANASAAHQYASIRGHIDDNTNGAEDGSLRFYVSVSGTETETFRTGENGVVLLQGGIKFPATQVSSTDANRLDDYEEGTFTPVLSFGDGTTGISYSVQEGFYTKIGRLCKIDYRITLTNKGSSTGVAKVSLPFTAANINRAGSSVLPYGLNFQTNYNPPDVGQAATQGSASSTLYTVLGGTSLTEGQFNNNTDFIGNLTYHTT